jgi:hypothetical protein
MAATVVERYVVVAATGVVRSGTGAGVGAGVASLVGSVVGASALAVRVSATAARASV